MNRFPWGTILREIAVGPYNVIEYKVGPQWKDSGKIQYYVNGSSWGSLEWAMLDCVRASVTCDERATSYAGRVLGLPESME